MDALERIEILLKLENVTREEVADKTGIGYNRWSTVMNKRGRLSIDELEALSKIFPEYEIWIHTGKEFPEINQISPITKLQNAD